MNDMLLLPLAIIAVAGLAWWYHRSRVADSFSTVMSQRPATATVYSRAQWIDGANHVVVALGLEPLQITYRNHDFDASIDINRIDEVEYASDLVTGGIAHGAVLRVRAHGRAIEFVLDSAAADEWSRALPPHRFGDAVPARA